MKKILVTLLCFSFTLNVHASRIKDISYISGIRNNHLVGYGLVVGLDGSGDNNSFTLQSFKTMLTKFGVKLPDETVAKSKNIAAVAIHADLPAFGRPGQLIDVTVSSIGDAKSLRGGTLLMAPLKGADGKVYAMAQGNLVVGGFGAEGKDGSKIKVNVPVVGRIPNGATIERDSPATFLSDEHVTYMLHRPDFTTVERAVAKINQYMGSNSAKALDGASLQVSIPKDLTERIKFLSTVENLKVTLGEEAAKVIVNSRTGTIVVGKHVTVGPAAVSHGSLTVTISEDPTIVQPEEDVEGATTEIQEQSTIDIMQENSKMFMLKGVSLNEIVKAINQVGASPGDLMAILEALKQAGALSARLEII